MEFLSNSLIRLIIGIGAMWIVGSVILILLYGLYIFLGPLISLTPDLILVHVILAPLVVGAVIYLMTMALNWMKIDD